MAQRRKSMREIKEVLRLHESGIDKSKISSITGVSRKTVRSYLTYAHSISLKYSDVQNLSESEIYSKLFPVSNTCDKSKPQPGWDYIHKEMQKKGVTKLLLWQEFIEKNNCGLGYSRFCHYYREYLKTLDLSMRQTHKLGEKCFVDYAGHTINITNQFTGEIKKAQIFVCVLGTSNYTFSCATWTQSLSDWIDSHIKAFEYFGGVPEIVVVDNLKSGVTKSCRYEPEINKTYHDFAMHYGVVIMPTRARKPKDKAKVENAVLVVERWILACLRNHTFFSLDELNTEILRLLEKLNSKQFKKLKTSRKQIFQEDEKSVLKALPQNRFEFTEWKKVIVNIDYHVELDSHYYSVPYQYVGEKVDICYTKTTVSIFKNNKLLARHPRSNHKGRHTVIKEHMPQAHQEYNQWTPTRIISWATSIGENTGSLVNHLIKAKEHPALAYRQALGIIRFAKRYGNERLENASTRALLLKAYSYQSIKSILEKGLDKNPLEVDRQEINTQSKTNKVVQSINHENIRGAEYFRDIA